jgi:hypothetical protein
MNSSDAVIMSCSVPDMDPPYIVVQYRIRNGTKIEACAATTDPFTWAGTHCGMFRTKRKASW